MRSSTYMVLAVAMAAALFCSASPGTGVAAEDAGTRSALAYGSGNRALALGSAYSAVSNDASALIWNAGGLGLVRRAGVQGTRSTFYGLDFTEYYASLVLPSWRWGTAAITVQHLGVEGIEARDDRNQILAEDLSDSETAVMVGYGRSLGSAWSLGGALKYQQQSLAGLSSGAIGLDLGFIVRPVQALGVTGTWADGLSTGLSVRNLIEPTLRLDLDEVSDPTSLRFGMAYERGYISQRGFLVSFDIEKTSEVSVTYHAGLELRPHPLLDLRIGFNNGALTAGTGLRWRDVGVNYTLEDSQLGSVHRLGLSFEFGHTVEESRQLAIQTEEEHLQEQLTKAFEARRTAQLGELLSSARTALGAARYEHALDLVSTVETLDPANEEASELRVKALRGQAEELLSRGEYAGAEILLRRALSIDPDDATLARSLERCESEGNRVAIRSEAIRQQFAAAMDAFSAEDFIAARAGFEQIVATDPGDEVAAEMLARTNRAVNVRSQNMLALATRLIRVGDLSQAAALVEQAHQLDPDAAALKDARRALEVAKQDLEAGGAGAAKSNTAATTVADEKQAKRPELTSEQEKEIAGLYQRGMTAAGQGRTDDALRYWELVWSMDPGYQRVSENLKTVCLARGMEFFAGGMHEEAVSLWQLALRVDPSDRKTRSYLARAQERLTRSREILGESD